MPIKEFRTTDDNGEAVLVRALIAKFQWDDYGPFGEVIEEGWLQYGPSIFWHEGGNTIYPSSNLREPNFSEFKLVLYALFLIENALTSPFAGILVIPQPKEEVAQA